MRRALAAPIAVLVFLAAPAPASAAPPTPEARARAGESFREAQAAFERRDFAAAAAAFEAAAGFALHPAALLSAGDAWDRAGEPARAAEDCDHARSLPDLAAVSAAEHVDYARDAAACLERLRPRVALIDVRGPTPATVRVDDGPQQLLPLRAWVRPGRHALAVVDLTTSRRRRETVDVRAGEERRIDLAETAPPPTAEPPVPAPPPPAPVAPTPPAPVSTSGAHVPAAAWVAAGVAVPAAIAWGVFAAMTLQAKNAYDAGPTEDAKNTFYRDRTLADVAFAVAAASAATGLMLWLVAPSSASQAPPHAGVVAPGVLRF